VLSGAAVNASRSFSGEVVFDGGNARPERGEKCVDGSFHIGSVGPGNGFSVRRTVRMFLPAICRIAAYLSACCAGLAFPAILNGIGKLEISVAEKPMRTQIDPTRTSDQQVRALLEHYDCPVPFHEVRTWFLGNIATPAMSASPIKVVEDLWGGELPTFDSIDAANELVGALVMGLWNRLTRHQDRSSPFRLMRVEIAATGEGLTKLALMRRQELDGFIEGLFARAEKIDLPERAHRGLNVLGEMRASFQAVLDVAADETKSATDKDMETTLRHMREMTTITEREMHSVVLSCKRARKQILAGLPARKPTLH
jgi:hypothetical protein